MSRAHKHVKQFFKSFRELLRQNKFSRSTLVVSVFLFLCTLVLPIWRIVPIASEQQYVPLHYNVYFGVDRFGPWYAIFVLPILGLVFLIVNVVLQTHFALREKLLVRFFSASTVILELNLFVAMVLIVLLNI